VTLFLLIGHVSLAEKPSYILAN